MNYNLRVRIQMVNNKRRIIETSYHRAAETPGGKGLILEDKDYFKRHDDDWMMWTTRCGPNWMNLTEGYVGPGPNEKLHIPVSI